jgi:hypothetical protein
MKRSKWRCQVFLTLQSPIWPFTRRSKSGYPLRWTQKELERVMELNEAEWVNLSGWIPLLTGGPIDWRAGKQKTVTTSSTEAELLGLTQTSKETYWWKRFFKGLGLDLEQDIAVQCDNTQTIDLLTKNAPELSTKLKHVDSHRHWLQEVQRGKSLLDTSPNQQFPVSYLSLTYSTCFLTAFLGICRLRGCSWITDATSPYTLREVEAGHFYYA